ncbi:PREDICTED: protein spinster homolog 3-like isoform X1 [Crocodylus porosus]|uniref:protein spinster homolog 3-like isoform X1 n=1 Tax=Crocodylus porosus TaxID=8502 RepID=UPI000938C21B|nr:PREDICTED: protein spinster homolog 3-like isoform X1 [Crocodylus porosus]
MENSVPEWLSETSEKKGVKAELPHGRRNYGTTEPSERAAQFSQASGNISAKRTYLVVGVLCFINLINFMDWYLVPGVLLDIQKYFGIHDSKAGLLQTVFLICYMLFAPVFGYLGDRYNRKKILGVGIFLWSGVTLGSSFIPESYSWLFFLSRALVGIGTSSYSTVAPTFIGDLFEEGKRTTMLSVFYIFIPVGSGFGYILASSVTQAAGHWHWAFRITPCMGGLALVFVILLIPNTTQRTAKGFGGQSITDTTQVAAKEHEPHSTAHTTWCKDVKSLGKNRSFIWSTLGFTAVAFVTGVLGFWMPVFLYRAELLHGIVSPCLEEPCRSSNSLIFGAITVGTGIFGVVTGAEVAKRWRKINSKADPLLCSISMFISALFLYVAIMVAQENIIATYVLIALAEFFLSLNWAVGTDMLLCIVEPNCQSTGIALQILVSHLLGDSGSPYLIGIISDTIQNNHVDSYLWQFRSLQYSFITCSFVGVFGGGFFLLTTLYFDEDRKEVFQRCRGIENKGYVSNEEGLGDKFPKE